MYPHPGSVQAEAAAADPYAVTLSKPERNRTQHEGRLDRVLTDHMGTLQELHSVISALGERLRPLLYGADELGITTPQQVRDAGAGGIGNAIEGMTETATAATARLRDILDRLEI